MLRGEFKCRQLVFWGTGTKRLGTPGLDSQKVQEYDLKKQLGEMKCA